MANTAILNPFFNHRLLLGQWNNCLTLAYVTGKPKCPPMALSWRTEKFGAVRICWMQAKFCPYIWCLPGEEYNALLVHWLQSAAAKVVVLLRQMHKNQSLRTAIVVQQRRLAWFGLVGLDVWTRHMHQCSQLLSCKPPCIENPTALWKTFCCQVVWSLWVSSWAKLFWSVYIMNKECWRYDRHCSTTKIMAIFLFIGWKSHCSWT